MHSCNFPWLQLKVWRVGTSSRETVSCIVIPCLSVGLYQMNTFHRGSHFEEMDDVTECCICTDVFNDPRVLPCIHTFCLKCIQGWSKDKRPGDKLECPLCRKDCCIPEEGLVGLPRNFFVEKMLRIRDLTSVKEQSTLCDICTYRADSGATKINSATTYCLECQENLCNSCATAHRKQKMSRDHKVLQIGDKVKAEDLYAQYPAASCEKHANETLKIYCNECRLVICMMCYIKDHNSHRCADVSEVVDEFQQQLTSDADSVVSGMDRCKQMLQALDGEKKRFNEQISTTELEIREKAKHLKDLIEKHKQSLLTELMSIKDKREKEMKVAYDEVKRHLAAMESYKKYVREIQEKGSPCDIARAASGLHDRATELLMFNVMQRTMNDLGRAEITLTSPDFEAGKLKESMGVLQMNLITLGKELFCK